MLLFEENGQKYAYIHIPKNSGKYMRKKIKNKASTKVIQNFWFCHGNVDKAHIPYMWKEQYVNRWHDFIFFAHSRNPYHRIISAFFHKNKEKTINDFKMFILNELPYIKFNYEFHKENIHYYPQYFFICDNDGEVNDVQIEKIENIENPREYILRDYFDIDTLQIVNEVYSIDFDFFKYDKVNW